MARSAQDIFDTANTQRTPEEWSNYYASGRNQPIPDLKFDLKEGIQLPPFAGLPQVTEPEQPQTTSLADLTASGLDMNLMNQVGSPLQQEATGPTAGGSVGVNGPDGAVGEPGIPEVTDINSLEGALAVINTVTNANLGGASIPQFGGERSPDLARPAFDNGASQGDVNYGDQRLLPLSYMSSKIPVATIPQLNPNIANEWDATSAMVGYRPNPDMTGYKPYDYSNTLMPIGVLKSQGQR